MPSFLLTLGFETYYIVNRRNEWVDPLIIDEGRSYQVRL